MNGRKRSADDAFAVSRSTGKSRVVNFQDSEPPSASEPPEKQGHGKAQPRVGLKDRAGQLLINRQRLPIWNHADEIRSKVRSHNTLLLVGETGSGKSTQVPQFLINEKWCQRKRLPDGSYVGGCIAITQPRRVAATSLARRVAEEIGTPLGSSSPASLVGYSVRFDNSTGPATRIKFVTEGMLLQEMLRDPWLKEYSAVIVDEVHERGMNVDLVLGFLRRMHEAKSKDDGRGGVEMKVVVMSATADMDKVRDFLDLSSGKNQNEEWSGFSDDDDNTKGTSNGTKPTTVATQYIKGRQYPVEIHYSPAAVADILDAALQRIIDIHTHSPLPGDILVFLTGQETVESLLSLIESYSASIRKDPALRRTLPQLLLLPLYAALPPHLQQRVFQSTPNFTRKIILATNIAETSITVPGIRHVIDCGKHKRRLFRPSLNLDSLLTTSISRSSAKQRSGRAGRDGPGHAYRLYTESDFYKLEVDTEPEILRCDLSQLVLILKSHNVDNVANFPLLTQPPRRALERALIHLLQLSALHPTSGQITQLGRRMSALPLPAPLARILLASIEPQYNCLDEIIDIVSALSVENLFLNIHNSRNLPPNSQPRDSTTTNYANQDENNAEDDGNPGDPRLQLRQHLTRREGDHLTLLATVQAYVSESADRKRWCEDRAISHRAMQAVMDVRKQLGSFMVRYQRENKKNDKKKKETPGGVLSKNKQKTAVTINPNTTNTAAAAAAAAAADDNDVDSPPPPPPPQPSSSTAVAGTNSDLTTRILRTLLTGLHPNVARLSLAHHPSSSTTSTSASSTATAAHTAGIGTGAGYTTLATNQPLQIHPSSVLFGRHRQMRHRQQQQGGGGGGGVEAIVYSEFVFTNRAYARGVSAVELGWVVDAAAAAAAGTADGGIA